LYLLSPTGLIQCLHEIGAKKPTYYSGAPIAAPEKPKREGEYRGNAQPSGKLEPAPAKPAPAKPENENPFGNPPAAEDANPFGPAEPAAPQKSAVAPAEKKPAAPVAAPSDDNPFGS
jgi:hypothetical protein